MWHAAEPDYLDYQHQNSYTLLLVGLLLSVVLHAAGLAIELASKRTFAPTLLHITLEKLRDTVTEPLEPLRPIDVSAEKKQIPAKTPSATGSPQADAQTADSANKRRLNIDQALQDYLETLPEVQGSDLEGRVFDPVLAAKIYEARKNSKARPGFGPGSFEEGSEHSVADPRSYVYSGGSSQRWVKVDDKCFLVHDDSGVGPLRGAFDVWMRTSCKKFNPKFFDDR